MFKINYTAKKCNNCRVTILILVLFLLFTALLNIFGFRYVMLINNILNLFTINLFFLLHFFNFIFFIRFLNFAENVFFFLLIFCFYFQHWGIFQISGNFVINLFVEFWNWLQSFNSIFKTKSVIAYNFRMRLFLFTLTLTCIFYYNFVSFLRSRLFCI